MAASVFVKAAFLTILTLMSALSVGLVVKTLNSDSDQPAFADTEIASSSVAVSGDDSSGFIQDDVSQTSPSDRLASTGPSSWSDDDDDWWESDHEESDHEESEHEESEHDSDHDRFERFFDR